MGKEHPRSHRSDPATPSSEPVTGEPDDVWEQINKFGTYECQDTTATENTFPLIGPLGSGVTGIVPERKAPPPRDRHPKCD